MSAIGNFFKEPIPVIRGSEIPILPKIPLIGWAFDILGDIVLALPATVGNMAINTVKGGAQLGGTIVGVRSKGADGKYTWTFNVFKTWNERLSFITTPIGKVVGATKSRLGKIFRGSGDLLGRGYDGVKNLGNGAKNIVTGSASSVSGALSGDGSGLLNTRLGRIVSRPFKKTRLIASRPFRKIAETAQNLNTFVAPYLDGSGKLTEAFKNTTVGNYIVKTGDFAMNFDTIATNALKKNIQQPLIDNFLSPGEKQLEKLAAVPGNIINTFTATLDTAIGSLSAGVDRLLSPMKQLEAALVPVKKS